jgi:hypothetical protein
MEQSFLEKIYLLEAIKALITFILTLERKSIEKEVNMRCQKL